MTQTVRERESDLLRKELGLLKVRRREQAVSWEPFLKLAQEVSRQWRGERSAVAEIRRQREK